MGAGRQGHALRRKPAPPLLLAAGRRRRLLPQPLDAWSLPGAPDSPHVQALRGLGLHRTSCLRPFWRRPGRPALLLPRLYRKGRRPHRCRPSHPLAVSPVPQPPGAQRDTHGGVGCGHTDPALALHERRQGPLPLPAGRCAGPRLCLQGDRLFPGGHLWHRLIRDRRSRDRSPHAEANEAQGHHRTYRPAAALGDPDPSPCGRRALSCCLGPEDSTSSGPRLWWRRGSQYGRPPL